MVVVELLPTPGPTGAFDKDEALALTFADKVAKKGLPSAEFAMGLLTLKLVVVLKI